ncbi:cytochrome c biogenesis protein DipZ [Camelimonas sp. ID_303_24]
MATLLIIAFLGGVLTIVSPCILPVLPFVFARAGQPFLRSTLPMLAGMAITFAIVASLAAIGGAWAVRANEYGRIIAMALLAAFGLSLLSPRLAAFATRPMVRLGERLLNRSGTGNGGPGVAGSLALGVATGLLWAPCAGPILGLLLTGAALNGANVSTTLLLLAYAAGAATSIALALLAGGRIFDRLKRSPGVAERVRQGLGVAVLAGVAAIALGLDTGLLSRLSYTSTATLEQAVVDRFRPKPSDSVVRTTYPDSNARKSAQTTTPGAGQPFRSALPDLGPAPAIAGATDWLNAPPLTSEQLRGKVVLVDFWTYSCINCIRTMPYLRAWAAKYRDQGLVVLGVHTPEFAFEKNLANVRKAIGDFGIVYPVAVDNDYAIWRAFSNEYWPAHYLIDANGRIRYRHFGEGQYAETGQAIQDLLREAGASGVVMAEGAPAAPAGTGAEAAPDVGNLRSHETYLGYKRAENFASAGGLTADASRLYEAPQPQTNQWGLAGAWTVGAEHARLDASGGAISYRFSARDLHLVLGPGPAGKPVRFVVTIDGKPPGDSHGVDIDAAGAGTVTENRLYQLVRQKGDVTPHNFEIRFLDPGVEAYAFTFG